MCFAQKSLNFLGHRISQAGIHIDPDKCKAILEWGTPKKAKDIRSFLVAAGYYRIFVPGFSGPVSKQTPLIKKNVKFTWTNEQQQELNEIKKQLTTPPVLKPPEFGKPFLVITYAS